MNTDEIIEYWAASMRAQHCTERTIKERQIFIRSVMRRTGAKSLLTVQKQQLVLFLGRPGLTGKTKQNYRSCLHTFFTWLQDEDLRADNPAAKLPKPQVERNEPNPVTTAEIQTVLNSGIYGHTIMKVLLYSYQGFRAAEIAAVAGDNIDWDRKMILSKEGKGRKEVWRPLHRMVYEYAVAAGYPRTGFWFPGRHGHIRAQSVSTTLSAAFTRAGIAHTGHDMRKWHGTTLLALKVDSLTIQHSLRHTDQQSMRAYVLPDHDSIREAQDRLPRVNVPVPRKMAA